MPTSPQQFFLGISSLLAVLAADVQAQMRPAPDKATLVTLASKREAHANRRGSEALRGINTTITLPRQSVQYSWSSSNRWENPTKNEYVYDASARLTQETQRDSASNTAYSRNLYTYDAQGNQTSYTTQYWNSNAWVNSQRYLYTYNAQGRETSYTSQNWNNNAWVNERRYLSTYDAQGNETESLSQEWKGSSWVTYDGSQTAYTYNAAGIVLEAIEKEYDNGTFVLEDREVFTVTNGQWSSILIQSWVNGAWQNEERLLDLVWYDWSKQQIASYREQEYDGTSFVDDERATITYSNNGSQVSTSQRYNGTIWVNDYRSTESIDNFGNYIGYTGEEWVNNAWSLEYGYRNQLFYNASNVVLRRVSQSYDNAARQWRNDSRFNYSSFQSITLAARNAALEARATLYPNPAAGLVTLDVADVKDTGAATGEVRNALGQLVQQFTARPQQGQIRTQLDLSNLKAGIYTVRLQTGDGALVKRVVRN